MANAVLNKLAELIGKGRIDYHKEIDIRYWIRMRRIGWMSVDLQKTGSAEKFFYKAWFDFHEWYTSKLNHQSEIGTDATIEPNLVIEIQSNLCQIN